MIILFCFWQLQAHASLPDRSIPDDKRIFRLPWWERTPPPPPPPEASTPPVVQPYSLGEFDPVDGIVFTTWYSDTADTWTGMIRALVDRGVPTYVCDSPMPRYWAEIELRDAGIEPSRIEWLDCELETVWMRDFGPMFTINEDAQLGIGDARYYADRYLDDSFPEQASDWWGVDFYEIPVWLEGGNFYADGQGTCVATNIVYEWYREYYPSVTAELVSAIFQNTLGCDETIWLEPLDGEGTGHVDMFFTYVDHENVIVGAFSPDDDVFGSNAALLDRNAAKMAAAGYTVHRVPMLPNEDIDGDGYADFHTVINGFFANLVDETPLFIAPSFPSRYPAETATALASLRSAMPGVDVVPIPAETIIIAGGALHCVMKSIPTARWPRPCEDPYVFNDDDPRCEGLMGGDDGGATTLGDAGGSDGDDGEESATDGGINGAGSAGDGTMPSEADTGLEEDTDEDATTGGEDTSGGTTGADTFGTTDGGPPFEAESGSESEDAGKKGCATTPQRGQFSALLLALALAGRIRRRPFA